MASSASSAAPRRSRWPRPSPRPQPEPHPQPTPQPGNPTPQPLSQGPDPDPEPGPPPEQEGKRQQLATAAYQKGVKAFNKFIAIGNDGMGLQVRSRPALRATPKGQHGAPSGCMWWLGQAQAGMGLQVP